MLDERVGRGVAVLGAGVGVVEDHLGLLDRVRAADGVLLGEQLGGASGDARVSGIGQWTLFPQSAPVYLAGGKNGAMGGTSDRLRQRARRRADWLADAAVRFEQDADVAAAWAFGSEGRGEADELSDVDLFVAVVDDVADKVLAGIDEEWFRAFGAVLTIDDISESAPEGGRAFVVTYPSPVERLTVTCWFQAASTVQLGNDVRVLVDKVGLAVADPPLATTSMLPGGGPVRAGGVAPRRSARRVDRLQERITWFWTMAPVAAKWLARGWVDRADPEVERMSGVVDEATAFLNRQPMERQAEPGPVRPLSRLRAAMVELSMLCDALVEAGVTMPSTDVAFGWLELAEDLEAERWVPNSPS